MNQKSCALWKTRYESDFNQNTYLYHYTSISSAAKILHTDSLKFSKLSRMNDTMEAKPIITSYNPNHSQTMTEIVQYFQNTNRTKLQLLCLSRDYSRSRTKVDDYTKYADYSGRGFALPRMWAQYAANNCGVCLIFNKSLLIQLIKDTLGSALIHVDNVKYIPKFKTCDVDEDTFRSLDNYFISNKNDLFRDINAVGFFKKHIDFVKYNYFTKLDDWEGEREFRFLAYGDEEYFIRNVRDALEGIVVGECVDGADLSTIQHMCPINCDIIKINFTLLGCLLSDIERSSK